ncbi:phage shock protein A, PspA [Rippkaea orientalis PCC 8801]|uniref:Phage shock protein A, PspA n=1 Tax=Rippkaea orientalis (strain PCC 8801 / RF-1) TaxID=41431 RepID=B7JY53_RIPO1|nr:PspA/IM30 family protein [Rippkaea orientalis]ACK67155.1 phage shock protein A, PspA [Rippkaea orientalis PCC 8801]
MEWLGRIGKVVQSQINTLIKEAEDPEKVLENAIAAMEQELIAMRRALAEAIATNKSAQRQFVHHQKAADKWYERAQMALEKGNEPLAREALVNRQAYQIQAQSIENQLAQQNQIIAKVKDDLRNLEHKYSQAKTQKSLYLARLRSAMASQRLQEVIGNLNPGNYSSVFEQIETRILELEAQSELTQTVNVDPLEKQFAALENNKNIDEQLANLKAKKLTSDQPSSSLPSEIEQLRAKLDQI